MSDVHDWFDDIGGKRLLRDALEKMEATDKASAYLEVPSNWQLFLKMLQDAFAYRGEPHCGARRSIIEAVMGFEQNADFAQRLQDVAVELLDDGDDLLYFEVRRGNRILSSNTLNPKEIAEMDGEKWEDA